MSTENTNFKELLKEVTKDILSEDSLAQIQEAFDAAVNERVDIHVEKALVEQDDNHTTKLEKLLEAIDTDHSSKLESLVEAIDKNHAQKLQVIVGKYKSALNEEAGQLKEDLVENISNYLELYIDKTVPAEQINEAVSNKRAKTVLNELRQVLAVDGMLGKETVREAIKDGKKQIDESTDKLNSLVEENTKLRETLDRSQAELILERKTAGLPEQKRKYVTRVLVDKDPHFIAENFDYTLSLFEKQDQDQRENLKEQATTQRSKQKKNVDVIVENVEESVIEETASNLDETQDAPLFDTYMGELGKY
jgi:hypothetical protein